MTSTIPQFVKAVFDRCSDRYITFSLICSFGFTERWRQQCVAAMPALRRRDARGYDLMAGTGEVWPHLLKRFDDIGAVTAVDISSGMHRRAMSGCMPTVPTASNSSRMTCWQAICRRRARTSSSPRSG